MVSFNPIAVNNYASLFNCIPLCQVPDSDSPYLKVFILVGSGLGLLFVTWPTGVHLVILFYVRFAVVLFY